MHAHRQEQLTHHYILALASLSLLPPPPDVKCTHLPGCFVAHDPPPFIPKGLSLAEKPDQSCLPSLPSLHRAKKKKKNRILFFSPLPLSAICPRSSK